MTLAVQRQTKHFQFTLYITHFYVLQLTLEANLQRIQVHHRQAVEYDSKYYTWTDIRVGLKQYVNYRTFYYSLSNCKAYHSTPFILK